MGQLLVMLIVPPIVGVVTYIVIRRIWERDGNGASEAVTRRDPSAATPAEGTSTDLGNMRLLEPCEQAARFIERLSRGRE